MYFQIWIRTEKSINRNNFILPKISYPNFLIPKWWIQSGFSACGIKTKPFESLEVNLCSCSNSDLILYWIWYSAYYKKEASQYSTCKGLKGCSKQGIQIGHFSLHYSESYRPSIKRSHSKLIQIWIFFKFSFELDLNGNFLFKVWFKTWIIDKVKLSERAVNYLIWLSQMLEHLCHINFKSCGNHFNLVQFSWSGENCLS